MVIKQITFLMEKLLETVMLSLCYKVLVAGVLQWWFLLENSRSFPEPVPASFKTDLLLVKFEPISVGGSTSGIIYLRRGINCWATAD